MRLRILLWRTRWIWPVLGALAAALLVARTAAPPPAATVPVVVFARPVGAGEALTSADVRLERFSACCTPAGAVDDLSTHLGRELAVAVPRGLPLVEDLLRGPRFAVDPGAGSVVVPVMLAEGSAAALLRVGDRIDLVSTEPLPADDVTGAGGGAGGRIVLARAALVVEVPATTEHGVLPGPGDVERPVLVAVSPAEGHALAARSGWAPLGAVLVE